MSISREHELLNDLIRSPAWEGLLKPIIAEKVAIYYKRLLDPAGSRKDLIPDDFIRGQIEALRWVVTYPQMEIDEARRIDEEEEAAAKEAANVVPLFGGRRPAPENGEAHGRAEGSTE